MNTRNIVISVLVLALAMFACVLPTPPNSAVASSDATATLTSVPATPAATESATTTAPTFTATLEPTTTPNGASCVEDVLAVTSFADRELASVNGTKVAVQVRGNCPQPVFYAATGVDNGENYALSLPKGWVAITASVSIAVHPDGGVQTDYKGCPFLVINGPWDGSVGMYEGGIRVTTTEWADGLIEQILPIHSAQCGFPVIPTIFSGQ